MMKNIGLLLFLNLLLPFLTLSQDELIRVVDSSLQGTRAMILDDLDGDGMTDILCSRYWQNEGQILFYRNKGGDTFEKDTLMRSAWRPGAIRVFDPDANGTNEVLFINANTPQGILGYLQKDNSGEYRQHTIDSAIFFPVALQTADIDLDGDTDIVLASDTGITIYFNAGGFHFEKEYYGREIPVSTEFYDLILSDLNGDDYPEILAAGVQVFVFENQSGTIRYDSASSASVHADFSLIQLLHSSDLDGDGYPDLVLYSTDQRIRTYRNDGQGLFMYLDDLEKSVLECQSVVDIDWDRDGDRDIATAYPQDGTVVWYRNDGSARFDEKAILAEGPVLETRLLARGDLNTDGFEELVRTDPLIIHYNGQTTGVERAVDPSAFTWSREPGSNYVTIRADQSFTLTGYAINGQIIMPAQTFPAATHRLRLPDSYHLILLRARSEDGKESRFLISRSF